MICGLVGSGHVAHAFGQHFAAHGEWSGQWSRSGAEVVPGVAVVSDWSAWEVAFLAVADGALEDVAREVPRGTWRIHFSGAKPLEAVAPAGERGAVMWPICSIRKEHPPIWEGVHWGVEATDDDVFAWVDQTLQRLGGTVHPLSGEQRLRAHAAAVFAANFTNLVLAESADLLADTGLPWGAMHELAQGVLERSADPAAVYRMTGPAARGDEATMRAHARVLASDPTLQQLYADLSARITDRAHSNKA